MPRSASAGSRQPVGRAFQQVQRLLLFRAERRPIDSASSSPAQRGAPVNAIDGIDAGGGQRRRCERS